MRDAAALCFTARMTRIQAVTFDAGGTLVFPYPSVGAVYAEVMSRHGLDHGPEELEETFRRVWSGAQRRNDQPASDEREKAWWRAVVARILDELGHPADFDALFNELWMAFAEPGHWRLRDGARECLQRLRDSGYRLGILSNWDHRLRQVLSGLGLTRYFDAVVISAEVGCEKPDRGIFECAQRMLGVPAEGLLHVGDSLFHDIDGARAAGWRAVHIGENGFAGGGRDSIARFDELPALLALSSENAAPGP